MIRYDLTCDRGHTFDSWFASAAAYDRLAAAGHVACPDCGSAQVTKALMAPAVVSRTDRTRTDQPPPDHARADPSAAGRGLTAPRNAQEAALAELRAQVEANSDYVGLSFAAEARAMHEGRAPERAIHGEARLEDARKLLEDGVPVAPLPFLPARKTN